MNLVAAHHVHSKVTAPLIWVLGDWEMMKSKSLTALALVLAAGSFAFSGSAMAYDGENRDAAIGIIGGVIEGAVEADQAKKEAREHERHCVRLNRRCEDGSDWACRRYEDECGD
jgi:hypothetical protein